MAKREIEHLLVIGQGEATKAVFDGLVNSAPTPAGQVLLLVNQRDLWHGGKRIGVSTQTPGDASDLYRQIRKNGPFPDDIHAISLCHFAKPGCVQVRATNPLLDGLNIPTEGLDSFQSIERATRTIFSMDAFRLELEKSFPSNIISNAAWQGRAAIERLLPALQWNEMEVGQWRETLQEWLDMLPIMTGIDPPPRGEQRFVRTDRNDTIMALIQSLPGIHRDPVLLKDICQQPIRKIITLGGDGGDMEIRQRILSEWIGREETWQFSRMSLSLSVENTAWTMEMFESLSPTEQHLALANAWDQWASSMSNFNTPMSLCPQLHRIWADTRDWPEWPSLLAQWHHAWEDLPQSARNMLDTIKATQQQEQLHAHTATTTPTRKGSRL